MRGRNLFFVHFTRSNRWPRPRGSRDTRAGSVFLEGLDQESTEERLQGWRRRILRNWGRPRALNRLRCHNGAGGRSCQRSHGETPSPGLRFRRRRIRHAATRFARIRNGNWWLFRVVHSHVFAFRFGLWSCALARLRMHRGTGGNR